MNAKSKLKSLFAKALIAFSLLVASVELIAQEQQPADLKDFKIVIEKTETEIQMTGIKGSAWVNLSFILDYNQSRAIDASGMTKLDNEFPEKDPKLADFLFTISRTDNGVVLKGIVGTAWTELGFALSDNGKQAIDQFGMTK